MNCKTCNFALTEGQEVCPVCGTPVTLAAVDNNQSVTNSVNEVVADQKTLVEELPQVEVPIADTNLGVENNSEPTPSLENLVEVQEPVIFEQTPMEVTQENPVVEQNPIEIPTTVVQETPAIETTPTVEAPVIVSEPVLVSPTVQPELIIETPAMPDIQTPEVSALDSVPVVDAPVFPEVQTEENPVVESTPVMEPAIEPTAVVDTQVTPSVEPDIAPVQEQQVGLNPQPNGNINLPLEGSLEPNNVNASAMETPKSTKKGLGMIVTVLISIIVIALAAVAGFFGYRYLFSQEQMATLKGYKYRVASENYAAIRDGDTLLIYETNDKDKSNWHIELTQYSDTNSKFSDILAKKEEMKTNYEIEYEKVNMDTKKIKNREMLIFEVEKDSKFSYLVFTTNSLDLPLEAKVLFNNGKLEAKALDVLADIVSSSTK